MVDGKGNFDWQQTSSIEATIFNVNRSSKSNFVNPNQLNPYTIHKHKQKITGQFAWNIFKKIFQNNKSQ